MNSIAWFDDTMVTMVMMATMATMMVMILLAWSCCCGKLVAAPWVGAARYSNTHRHYTILSLMCDHVCLLLIL